MNNGRYFSLNLTLFLIYCNDLDKRLSKLFLRFRQDVDTSAIRPKAKQFHIKRLLHFRRQMPKGSSLETGLFS